MITEIDLSSDLTEQIDSSSKNEFSKRCLQKECVVKYARNQAGNMRTNHSCCNHFENPIGVSTIGIGSKLEIAV